ncbi:MAG: hypothetical protein ABIH99_04770 [Candidatus Micrarchaeota archaeon]
MEDIKAALNFGLIFAALASSVFIYIGMRNLGAGIVKKQMQWLLAATFLAGFPLALVRFLFEAQLWLPEDAFLKLLPEILSALFFIFILRAALYSYKIGTEFGFGDAAERIKKVLKEKNAKK